MKNIKRMELIGIIFTILVGSLLHFTYEWSGQNPYTALFSAVNESTWEHLKLLFFPYMLYAIIEYIYIGKDYPNFITAKFIGVICGLVLIPLLFYSYTYLLGTNYFVFDILIFVLAVIVSYVVSYYVLTGTTLNINTLSIVVLTLICLSFFRFTLNPPNCFLFFDPTVVM